jgi:hypothetical protein
VSASLVARVRAARDAGAPWLQALAEARAALRAIAAGLEGMLAARSILLAPHRERRPLLVRAAPVAAPAAHLLAARQCYVRATSRLHAQIASSCKDFSMAVSGACALACSAAFR